MSENSVVFKGHQNGILLILDDKIDFSKLKEALKKKVIDARDFFDGANTAITFKGRTLTEAEELELLDIVSKNSGLDISFVNKSVPNTDNEEADKEEGTEKKWKPTPAKESEKTKSIIPESFSPVLTSTKNITSYHTGSLRSGQSLEFNGSIVILGDINPGAEIRAEGNVIVLGKLKGKVHAGCKGASECFVAALYMNPTQLIISDVITYFPDNSSRTFVPEYAYIKDGQIFVEPLTK